MGEVLNETKHLKRNSLVAMILIAVVFFVASEAGAQDQALSTVPPSQPPPFPFLDLFTGASNYYSEPIRKAYSDHSSSYISCPKSDTLGSFASILGSASKIMLSAAVIIFLKLLGGKMMLFPLTVMLFAKMGLKALLLWPMISKMIKYFKKKKKKGHISRAITDCSERIACVIRTASKYGWSSNMGAAVTFSMIEDIDDDSSFAKIMLSILAGDKVARCMSVECISGVDIS